MMQKSHNLKAFALGGLDEVGKVAFVLEINEQIFVFDCGIKQLIEVDLGINYLIPDFSYLTQNAHRIQGVFLTSASDDLTGGIKFLLRALPQVKVYASQLTVKILTSKPDQIPHLNTNLHVLNQHNNQFGNVKIESFAIAADLPGTIGYIVQLAEKKIVYTSSFLLNNQPTNQLFSTDLSKICHSNSNETFLLIGNAQQANVAQFTHPRNRIDPWLKQAIESGKSQIYLACFETEWWKIYHILKQLATDSNTYQIIFFDKEFGQWYRTIMHDQHRSPNLQFETKDKPTKRIIFVTGKEKWLFNRIDLLINNKSHPLALNRNSHFMLTISKTVKINEINVYSLLNRLHTTPATIMFLNHRKLLSMDGAAEDLKLLTKLLNPRFFWPINGYHQHLIQTQQILQPLLTKAQIVIKKNGEIFHWTNNRLNPDYQALKLTSVFVEPSEQEFITEQTIEERKQLGERGIVLTAFYYQIKHNAIKLAPTIFTRFIGISLVTAKQRKINDGINNLINNHIKHKNSKAKLHTVEFQEYLKKNILLILQKETHKKPLVGLTIIEQQT